MAKPASFNKRELEKKKQEKRLEKQKRKEDRKAQGGSGAFEDMIAYVDEYGMISSTPPDLIRKTEVDIDSIEVSVPKKEDIEVPALKGLVDFFNRDKGFGFIRNLATKEKYFFHISNAPDSIDEGNTVTFELERGQKGMNAVNIVLTDDNK